MPAMSLYPGESPEDLLRRYIMMMRFGQGAMPWMSARSPDAGIPVPWKPSPPPDAGIPSPWKPSTSGTLRGGSSLPAQAGGVGLETFFPRGIAEFFGQVR